VAHLISGELIEFTKLLSLNAPPLRCEHLKKTKQQFWAVLGDERITCRECAVASLAKCSQCPEPSRMYFILSYLRGSTGNAPNYFIASACEWCSSDVEEGEWGIKFTEFRGNDGRLFFTHVKQITTLSIPETAIEKVKKEKKTEETVDELELA